MVSKQLAPAFVLIAMDKVIRFVKSSYFSLPGISWILFIVLALYVLIVSMKCHGSNENVTSDNY